jgi:hypothetical protein
MSADNSVNGVRSPERLPAGPSILPPCSFDRGGKTQSSFFQRGSIMNIKIKALLITVSAAILFTGTAFGAGVTITVVPEIAPDYLDGNGNPNASYTTWQTNALYALENGLSSYGTPGTPGYYTQQTWTSGTGAVTSSTDFNSWLGSAAAATGNYSNEAGNYLRFGLIISSSTPFELADVAFSLTDTANDLTFSFQGYDFTSPGIAGFNTTPNASFSNNVDPNSDPTATPITTLYYSGSGNSLQATCIIGTDCNPASEQNYIDNVLANNSLAVFSTDVLNGAYSFGVLSAPDSPNSNGLFSNSANFSVLAPEPSTWFLMISAVPAIAALRRRRKV